CSRGHGGALSDPSRGRHASDGGDQPTIDSKRGTRDVRGPLAREERNGRRVLLGVAITADRNRGNAFGGHILHIASLALRLSLIEKDDATGRDAARDDKIRGDPVSTDLTSQRLRPPDERRAKSVRKSQVRDRRDNARTRARDD